MQHWPSHNIVWLGTLSEGCDFPIPICSLHCIKEIKTTVGKTQRNGKQVMGRCLKEMLSGRNGRGYSDFLGYHLSTKPQWLIVVHSWSTTIGNQEQIIPVPFNFQWDRSKTCTTQFHADQMTCGNSSICSHAQFGCASTKHVQNNLSV